MKIKRLIILFHNRDERHWGFRLIRCRDGGVCEGQISGGQSNILSALTHDGKDWVRDYVYVVKPMREGELFAMPYAGCSPGDIRAWTRKRSNWRLPT
jgi:hypothetical protein